MDVYWKSKKLKSQIEDLKYLSKKYDRKVARNVVKRMKEIQSFPSYADLPASSHKHPIKEGKNFLYFAVDLPNIGSGRGKWRLIFEPYGDYDMSDYHTIRAVKIIGIEDYH